MMTCNGSTHNPSLKQIREMATRHKADGERVEKYQAHVPWLRDRKFLSDLESDSVDSEILEEELSTLQDEEPKSTRRKVAKYLQSHPVQVLLCVVVILDAGIVIAQILLDLHYFREKHYSCEEDLTKLLSYLRSTHSDDDSLTAYGVDDIDSLLKHLRKENANTHQASSTHTDTAHAHISDDVISSKQYSQLATDSKNQHQSSNQHKTKRSTANREELFSWETSHARSYRTESDEEERRLEELHPKERRRRRSSLLTMVVKRRSEVEHGRLVRTLLSESNTSDYNSEADPGHRDGRVKVEHVRDDDGDHEPENHHNRDVSMLHEVAHCLHIASICILGFLVIEDLVKAVAMGREFCKHKVEVFDAIIIVSSFVMDIVFLGGMPGDEGEKVAAVLVVLLLWRIARVVDGIVMTVKQKQEFRIRLQKRARRKAEKRIDNLEEDRHYKTRQVQALRDLCQRSGVLEEEIEACVPKKRKRTSSTASALTNVARLSVSMTMSMSSGLFSLADDTDNKLEELLPGGGGKSPDVTYARWKRDSTLSQDDGGGGISLDLSGRVAKCGRGMSLPDFRQRNSVGSLMASPGKKELLYSPSPTGMRRDLVAYSPGQNSTKREMLYNTGLNSTIKEESPASSRGNSVTTSPVNASAIPQIFIDVGSDNEDCCSSQSCDASCDTSVNITLPGDQPFLASSSYSSSTNGESERKSQKNEDSQSQLLQHPHTV